MLGIYQREEGRRGEEKGVFAGWLAGCLDGWLLGDCDSYDYTRLCSRLHLIAPFLHHAIDDPRISRQTSRRRVCCSCERIGIKAQCV
jgi:hypothetical protein